MVPPTCFSAASAAGFSPTGRILKHPGLALSTMALVCAVLTGCASSPLPPWSPSQGTRAERGAPIAGRVVPGAPPVIDVAPGGPGSNGAVITPVRPGFELVRPQAPGAEPAATNSLVPPEALPYSEAVAARFPAPAVVYATPGLAAGRVAFTTNAEMETALQGISADASGGGRTRAGLVILGRSQRGDALEALVVTRSANTDATTLLADGRPTVLLIGQQHGDEPAGSEALLVIAREAAEGLLEPLLSRINIIVVPRANPDGAAAGTRVTADGIDMNRDHLLLRTPEAQALAHLVRDYRPAVVVDDHEYTVTGRFLKKFNAVQRYDGLLQYATTANEPPFITKAAEEWFRRPMVAALDRQGLTSEWYYTTSTDPADQAVSMGGIQPDTGRNVDGLKNAVSLLLETRGVGIGRLHIQRRVHTHVTAVASVLQSAAARADDLKQLRSYVERDVSSLACREDAVLQAAQTPERHDLLMLDPVTGVDRTVNVAWNSSLKLRTLESRRRPCGYWLSMAETTAVERLQDAGVQVLRFTESGSQLADTYRETTRSESPRTDVRGTVADGSGMDTTQVKVDLKRSLKDIPAGSYYVPMSQPLANIVFAALEPDSQSSFFANHVVTSLNGVARLDTVPTLRTDAGQP
jgi:hypothetical protein